METEKMFKIQKNLLSEAVRMAVGAIEDTKDPNNPSQYLLMKATDGSLCLTVVRQDACSRLVIDKAPTGLLSIDKAANIALSGTKLDTVLNTYTSPDMMTVKLTPFSAPKPIDGATVMDLGKVDFRIPGVKKEEGFSMQTVDVDVTPSIDERGDTVVIAGADLAKYGKAVGMSAGKATQRSEFANILIKTSGTKLLLVTATSQQLAEATINRKDSGSDFSAVVPYEMLAKTMRVINPLQDVEIIYNPADAEKGTAGTVVFNQKFVFGGDDNEIGKFSFRITCSVDKFPQYEKKVGKTDFETYWVLVNTKRLKEITDRLACQFNDDVRTLVTMKPEDGTLDFKKGGDNSIDTHIDIMESSKLPIELVLSARHMKLATDFAENDATRIYFSGPESLAKFQCSDSGLLAYSVPFKGLNG